MASAIRVRQKWRTAPPSDPVEALGVDAVGGRADSDERALHGGEHRGGQVAGQHV